MGWEPPYVCQRLAGLAARYWHEFHGAMLLRGVYPLELPFAWYLDLVYAWALEGVKQEDRERFNATLFQPPAGASAATLADDPVWSDEAVFDQFMTTMAQTGARGRG